MTVSYSAAAVLPDPHPNPRLGGYPGGMPKVPLCAKFPAQPHVHAEDVTQVLDTMFGLRELDRIYELYLNVASVRTCAPGDLDSLVRATRRQGYRIVRLNKIRYCEI